MKQHFPLLATVLVVSFSISLSLNCGSDDFPAITSNNSPQIFGNWRNLELARSSCTDANNNFRRACNDCLTLVMNTDNTYQLTDDGNDLIQQGTFRLVSETEVTFDPGIFDSRSVSSVNYSLMTGSLQFTYQDQLTQCNVVESYISAPSNGGGS